MQPNLYTSQFVSIFNVTTCPKCLIKANSKSDRCLVANSLIHSNYIVNVPGNCVVDCVGLCLADHAGLAGIGNRLTDCITPGCRGDPGGAGQQQQPTQEFERIGKCRRKGEQGRRQ